MNGIELIVQERMRQVEQEGFDATHDKQHNNQELALAACYYAMPYDVTYPLGFCSIPDFKAGVTISPLLFFPSTWASAWKKRQNKSRIQQLVVAGALIAAEIDRIQADIEE